MISKDDLTNRAEGSEPRGAEKFRHDLQHVRGRRAAEPDAPEGAIPHARIVAARMLTAPTGACRACYQGGRDAVVGLLTRADDARPLADRLAEAAIVRPVHDHGGDPAFAQGRDAAIRAVVGDG